MRELTVTGIPALSSLGKGATSLAPAAINLNRYDGVTDFNDHHVAESVGAGRTRQRGEESRKGSAAEGESGETGEKEMREERAAKIRGTSNIPNIQYSIHNIPIR